MTVDTILPPDLEAAIAREAGEFYAFDDGTAREAFQRIARLAWEARGAADGWQPIASAPKGCLVILYRPAMSKRDRIAIRWGNDWCGPSCCPHAKPTHWRPRPARPSQPSDEPAQEPGALPAGKSE